MRLAVCDAAELAMPSSNTAIVPAVVVPPGCNVADAPQVPADKFDVVIPCESPKAAINKSPTAGETADVVGLVPDPPDSVLLVRRDAAALKGYSAITMTMPTSVPVNTQLIVGLEPPAVFNM